jgi:signal transduction histidine kinase
VRGHTTLGYLLLCVGDRPLGFVGLAWREAGPAALSLDQRSVLTALAQQLALAFELDRLAAVARTEATQAAVLVERTRIARDVHDTLAQGLAGIVMQIRAARAKLGAAEAPATPALDCVERLARDNLVEARRSLAMLRPAALEGYGLDAALRNVVGAARDVAGAAGAAPPGGPDLAFSVRGTPAGLPADVEMELLRIALAALANAVEHARARVIHVDLAYDGGGAAPPDAPAGGSAAVVRIAVSDDGRGFDGDAVTADRFGLVGMSERAARVGAVLTVVTAPGEGTEVVVMWRAAPGAAT